MAVVGTLAGLMVVSCGGSFEGSRPDASTDAVTADGTVAVPDTAPATDGVVDMAPADGPAPTDARDMAMDVAIGNDAPDGPTPDMGVQDMGADMAPTAPTCAISRPTRTRLNGVPAPRGDRASAPGTDYQAAFEVTTNVEDGRQVVLEVAPASNPTAINRLMAAAAGGKASFTATLTPDGDFVVEAVCTNAAGGTARSAKQTFTVDSTAPDLTVTEPMDGRHYNPGDLNMGRFRVCGTTTSTDAVGVPAVPNMAGNFCAAIGTASPVCAAMMMAAGGGSGCVELTCPGGAPFNITALLLDAAGNTTTKTVSNVSCSSSLPAVQIVSPVADPTPFTDVSKRLLAASAGQAFKDQNASVDGAQTDVVACTDRADGVASLFAGIQGGAISQVGASVMVSAAQASDGCPAGLGFVARFAGVTIPESALDGSGALAAPTHLRVDVVDASRAVGQSPAVNLWVDSIAPTVEITGPTGLCGSNLPGYPFTVANVVVTATSSQVSVTATNGTALTYSSPMSSGTSMYVFNGVVLRPGMNVLTAAVADPAGNTGALASPCNVTVTDMSATLAPVVTFLDPPAGMNILCANGNTSGMCLPDGDDTTAGWQGTLRVRVTSAGSPVNMVGTVTFTTDGNVTLGMSSIDANGEATLAVTNPGIPEGAPVTVTATTSDILGRGTGTASRMFNVDVTTPMCAGAITVLPPASEQERRDSTFALQWPAVTGATSYEVRYARMPASATDCAAFDWTMATPAGTTTDPNRTITKLFIETNYCFNVEATDGVNNVCRGMPVMAKRQFRRTILVPAAPGMGETANEFFGFWADGSGDVNGDGRSDLVVGTGGNKRAYVFFGGAGNFAANDASDFTGTSLAAPVTSSGGTDATIIQGTSDGFGGSVAFIGNFDGDGPPELAIAARHSNKVFIFKGRTTWPKLLLEAQADWVVQADPGMDAGYTIVNAATFSSPAFGSQMAAVGNFDGDAGGTEDFALSVTNYPWDGGTGYLRRGRVIVVRGQADTRSPGDSQVTVTLPDAARGITIEAGDNSLTTPVFGTAMVGLGRYFADGAGTTLAISAPGFGFSSSTGRVYAARWLDANGGTLSLSGPQILSDAGSNQGLRFGDVLTNLGAGGTSLPRLGIANTGDITTVPAGLAGTVYVQGGDSSAGPFGERSVLHGISNIGRVLFGGRVSGSDIDRSVVGGATDSLPDIGIIGQMPTVYILSGSRALSTTMPTDISSAADVVAPLPSGWMLPSLRAGGLVPDVNGDGVSDFMVTETPTVAPNVGRAVVFW